MTKNPKIGRPPSPSAKSSADRQADYRDRQARKEAELLTLVAALDRLVPAEDRARIEAIPTFASHLKTARTLAALLGSSGTRS